MELGLIEKKALVLASSSGIGQAVANSLIAEGVTTAINGRDQEKLSQAQKRIGAHRQIQGDLSQPGTATRIVTEAREKLGGMDILIVNSPHPPRSSFSGTSTKNWDRGYQDIWLNTVESIKLALPAMRANQWGRILLISSFAAKQPLENGAVSSSLRAGLLAYLKGLSREVAADGVSVNAILPGYTRTEGFSIPTDQEATLAPAKRLALPEEVSALAAFLASTQAAYITGQSIAIDGGLLRGII